MTQKDWDEVAKSFPSLVYKYRDWNNPFHQTIITKMQVYMSRPTDFEDKVDCKNHIRYDLLTDDQIKQRYYELSFEKHPEPGFSHDDRIAFANYWFVRSPLRDKEHIKKQLEKDFLEYDDRAGILSLTTNPKRVEMWVKYAADHTGFCVAFYPPEMFKYLGGGANVTYDKKLPDIMPVPWHNEMEQHILQVYHKEEKWAFEEEYRAQTFDYHPLPQERRVRTLTPESYAELIFGAKMSDKNRDEIIEASKAIVPKVAFKRAGLEAVGSITIHDHVDSLPSPA